MASYAKLLLFIVIVMAVVLPMVIKGPNGKPIMSLNDWMPAHSTIKKVKSLGQSLEHNARQTINKVAGQQEQSSTELSAGQAAEILPLSSNQMYKWKDKHGNWQFSNQKPVNSSSVQIEELPEVKNVMDVPITKGGNSSTIGVPDGLSLENAGELLKKMGLSTEQK